MTTGQSYLEHCASKNGRDGTLDLDSFVFTVIVFSLTWSVVVPVTTATSAASSWSFRFSCDNVAPLLFWGDCCAFLVARTTGGHIFMISSDSATLNS